MTLSEYLTRLRNDSGLTYQHIADQTGLHINTVQNIINGKTRSTSIDKAQRLVIVLGGSLDALKQLDYADGDPMVTELALIPQRHTGARRICRPRRNTHAVFRSHPARTADQSRAYHCAHRCLVYPDAYDKRRYRPVCIRFHAFGSRLVADLAKLHYTHLTAPKEASAWQPSRNPAFTAPKSRSV